MNHICSCLCMTLEAGELQGQAIQDASQSESHKMCPAVFSFN